MKIYWTESAVEDLNGIKGYIAREDSQALFIPV